MRQFLRAPTLCFLPGARFLQLGPASLCQVPLSLSCSVMHTVPEDSLQPLLSHQACPDAAFGGVEEMWT